MQKLFPFFTKHAEALKFLVTIGVVIVCSWMNSNFVNLVKYEQDKAELRKAYMADQSVISETIKGIETNLNSLHIAAIISKEQVDPRQDRQLADHENRIRFIEMRR